MIRSFKGTVTNGYGVATQNLNPVMHLIEARTQFLNLVPGTLNVDIPEEYIVFADAVVLPHEYPLNQTSNLNETIKFERCIVEGYKALIMRPDSHEIGDGQFHGKKHLELMGQVKFREVLGLANGSIVEVEVGGDEQWWKSGTEAKGLEPERRSMKEKLQPSFVVTKEAGREPARDPQDLERLLVSRERAGDVEGMAALYEPAAVLVGDDGRLVRGKEAIREFYAAVVASRRKFSFGEQRAALISGDLALTSTRMPDGSITAEVARRQNDGTWLWVIDRFSIL